MEMYESVDEAGWFPHDRSVSVWMPHGWIVGEFKECVSSSDVKTLALFCGHDENETSPHQMNVEIRGSMDAFESKKPSKWNCQRKEESISCKAKWARLRRGQPRLCSPVHFRFVFARHFSHRV
jgi:hypothetical protein